VASRRSASPRGRELTSPGDHPLPEDTTLGLGTVLIIIALVCLLLGGGSYYGQWGGPSYRYGVYGGGGLGLLLIIIVIVLLFRGI